MNKDIKKIISLFIITVMFLSTCISAAVVSDNDGSAFITKAEYDSLKNEFQSILDTFNTRIDQKIDDSIAAYLSGIKVSKSTELKLDENCKYLFPLVMCGPNNEWNDYTNDDYYDLSIPFCDEYIVTTYADRSKSRGADHSADVSTSYTELPTSLPVMSSSWSGLGATARIMHKVSASQYPGRVGTLNTLRRTTSKRAINGTNRTEFELVDRGRGQYNAYVRQSNGINTFWDGNAEGATQNIYNYPHFVGLDDTNFRKGTGNTLVWNVASGTRPTTFDWTKNRGMTAAHFMNSQKNYTFNFDGVTTIEEAINRCNSVANPYFGWYSDDASGIFRNPFLLLPSWEHMNGTNTCYYGTANMQGSLSSINWKYTPATWTTAGTQKISYTSVREDWNQSRAIGYNFKDTAVDSYTGVLPYTPMCYPYWKAADNNSFSQESSDEFSQLRASVVYYTDSSGKKHYLDEGMYIGRYNKDNATVEFTLRFVDDGGGSIRLALSKKPFGYDASTSNKIEYTYVGEDKVEHKNSAGNSATVQCNKTWKIKVDNINMGDELYMQWNPETAGHYVALESLTDYKITSLE